MDFFSSPNRMVPWSSRSRKIRTFHLSLIRVSVVSTGQGGRSARETGVFSADDIRENLLFEENNDLKDGGNV